MSGQWFVKGGEKVFGPIDSGKLKQLADAGRITRQTLIAKDSKGPWAEAAKVRNLFPVDGSVATPKANQALASVPQPPPIATPSANEISRANASTNPGLVPASGTRVLDEFSRYCGDGQDRGMVERLLKRVREICTREEQVLYMAVQQRPIANFSPDSVVVTNRRFIIFRQKMLGRMNFIDCLWKDCKNVHVEENIFGATMHFTGMNGHRESLDYLPKSQARMVYRHAQEMEEEAISMRRKLEMEMLQAGADKTVINTNITPEVRDDPVSKLTKLKTLLDAGVIDAAEFAEKKAELMRQL